MTRTIHFLITVLMVTFLLLFYTNPSYAVEEHGSIEHIPEIEKINEMEHHKSEKHKLPQAEISKQVVEQHRENILQTDEHHEQQSLSALTAQWIGLSTLLCAFLIFVINRRTKNKHAYKMVILELSLGIGIVHILLASDHLVDSGIAHGVYFAMAGIAQIGFGLLFLTGVSKKLITFGVIGTIGSVILYFITRIIDLPEPFGVTEGFDLVGIIAKIIELSLIVILVYLTMNLIKPKSLQVSKHESKKNYII